MSQYTERLLREAEGLSPNDEGYGARLLEIAGLFRGFGEALTAFLEGRGYEGEAADVPAKAEFLWEKFQAAGIQPPRDFRAWFAPGARLARKTAFQICFAFGLDVDETDDFFRRVQLERGFDCHRVHEAVYYFCLRRNRSYGEAQEIIGKIPAPQRVKSLPKSRDVLYTAAILDAIDDLDEPEALIRYLTDHLDDFSYHNATATRYIQALWAEIVGPEGLAAKKGALIDRTSRFEDRRRKGPGDTRAAAVIAAEVRHQENAVKPEDPVAAGPDASTWVIFSQIVGLANYQARSYAARHGRSLASVLSKSGLVPFQAAYCFPSRQNIDKLARGEQVGEDEIVRKLLIFLAFYAYWARRAVGEDRAFFSSDIADSARCLDTIHARLLDAGYPALYIGNPYDWLFLWALQDTEENPLTAFRCYLEEVFAAAEEAD